MEDVDELTKAIATHKVGEDSMGEHPRFSQYKNASRITDRQAARRAEALERQSEARNEKMNKIRKIVDSDEEEQSEPMDVEERTRRRYDGVLMTSEWLVDIPSDDSFSQWTAVTVPVGKRVLVVASRGETLVYNKSGRRLRCLSSRLPGGGPRSRAGRCLLDCVVDLDRLRFYVIDLIQWNEQTFHESSFNLRLYYLTSRLEEHPELGSGGVSQASFHAVPSCKAESLQLQALMESEMPFPMDGVLFYHPEVLYTAGQSPLVGWLKPWMLPEVLHVPIPPKFTAGAPSSARNFIEEFNQKHKHVSMVKNANN